MVIELEHKDGICTLRFQGRLVAGVDSDLLRTRAEDVKKTECGRVLADFRDVTAIGSTGIGFIVGLYSSVTKIPDGRFVVVGATARVREVFDLTRLSNIIPMVADMATGLKVLRGASAAGG